MLLRSAGAAVVVVAGCGPDGPAIPDARPILCTVGDLAAEPEMQLIYRTGDGDAVPLDDGGRLPLLTPPQGGKVSFVGVRVKNVTVCGATIQAALRDPCDGRVLGIERRPIAWRIADDGFAEPAQPAEISDYVNLPMCPNAGAERDVDGHPYSLEVRLYERTGRATERIVTVVPHCDDDLDPPRCRCECDADLGQTTGCPTDPDGGVIGCPPDAGP
jgi:hypothetical protein